jgi:2-methylisocitrate lyase-like PEP mutase family enzyme
MTVEEIRAVCDAVSRPVNVLARPDLSLRQLVDAGARRISVGGALTWVAAAGAASAAIAIRDRGDFSSLAVAPPPNEWLTT